MIVRIVGVLESLDQNRAVVAQTALALAREVLLPTYLSARMTEAALVGQVVTLHTLEYLESQGQGSSFIPRILGFDSPKERDFFELLTTVKGLGNKRALRCMAREPAWVAQAILARNPKALQELPEIGRKLADTIILELAEKAREYASAMPTTSALDGPADVRTLPQAAQEAVAALVGLGESPPNASRMVERVIQRSPALASTEEILAEAYRSRTSN